MDNDNEAIKIFLGKKVRLFTKRGFTYVGMVMTVGSQFLTLIDKYTKHHFFSLQEIEHIEEVME